MNILGFYISRRHKIADVGQVLHKIHTHTSHCDEQSCVIHSPSDHSMREFPTSWRGDRYLMERICPHGVGHPDPDDQSYKKRTMSPEDAHADSIHGCDGCCT